MLEDLVRTASLLVPGYLLVRSFLWTSHGGGNFDVEATLWCLMAGLALLAATSESWAVLAHGPTFLQIVNGDARVSWPMILGLLGLAPISGVAFGCLINLRLGKRALARFGILSARAHDPQSLVSGAPPGWCQVLTKTGRTYCGWPRNWHRQRDDGGDGLYLVLVEEKTEDGLHLLDDVHGIWFDRSEIARVAFFWPEASSVLDPAEPNH